MKYEKPRLEKVNLEAESGFMPLIVTSVTPRPGQ